MRLPASWQDTGGGPAGHGDPLGGGNFRFDGTNQNNVEKAVNAIPAKGVANVVATTNQAGTYSQPGGSAVGVGATFTYTATGLLVLDGHTVIANEYVLLVGQTALAQNGFYKCTTAGAVGVAAVLTRAPVLDSSLDFPGAMVYVGGDGNIYKGTMWLCMATGTPVMGTDPLPFAPPRVKKRVATVNDPTSISINTDTAEVFKFTGVGISMGLGVPLGITISGGNPGPYDPLMMVFVDNGGQQALAWDSAKFGSFGIVALPAQTAGGSRKMTLQFLYDPDATKYELTSVDIVGY